MNVPNAAIQNRVADSFSNEDCYTIEAVAKELGLKPIRARQLIKEAIDKRLVQNLTKKDGVRLLFPEPMIKQLKKVYENGTLVKPRRRKMTVESTLRHAELLLQVPIFDRDMANILLERFGTNEELVKYLTEQLFSIYKPVLNKLKELETEYINKKKALFQN